MTTNSNTLRLKYQDKDFKAHMTEANKRRVDSYMKKRLTQLAQKKQTTNTAQEEPLSDSSAVVPLRREGDLSGGDV